LCLFQGSRGGLLASISASLCIGGLAFSGSLCKTLYKLISRPSYGSLRVFGILVLAIMAVILAINFYGSRFSTLLLLFDPSIATISPGTANRIEWYSLVFNPAQLLATIDSLGSESPPWGTYPHNIFLDVLGNFGILAFCLLLISIYSLFVRLRRSLAFSLSSAMYISWPLIVLLSSQVSGTAYDYYSVFSCLPLMLHGAMAKAQV